VHASSFFLFLSSFIASAQIDRGYPIAATWGIGALFCVLSHPKISLEHWKFWKMGRKLLVEKFGKDGNLNANLGFWVLVF